MHRVWYGLVTLGLLAAQLVAQPAMFASCSLDAAREESIRTKRLLIVYLRGDGKYFDEMDATTWKSPTLLEWMIWHGIASRIDRHDDRATFDAIGREVKRQIGVDPRTRPMVLVFREGRLERTIPDSRFQGYLLGEKNPVIRSDPLPNTRPPAPYPTTLQVLYGLDLYYDTLRSIQATWLAAHELRNPMPPPPPLPPPLFAVTDQNAPAFELKVGIPLDPMEILREARALVAAGATYEATGHYSYLWEQTPPDSTLRAIVTTLAADDLVALVEQRSGTRARFEQHLERAMERRPWWTYSDVYEWMVLQRIVGDTVPVIEYFDLYTNDPQEAAIVSPADRAAYRLLTGPGGPIETAAVPELDSWVRRQLGHVNDAAPQGCDPKQWTKFLALQRRMVMDNACRVYSAHIAGRAPDAADTIRVAVTQVLPDAGPVFDGLRPPRD